MATTVVSCPHCGKKNRVPAAAKGRPQCANCHNRLPWLADAGDDDFAEIVDEAALPVLLDLWAPWCGPCRMVSPALERLAGEFAGRVKLVKVNVDAAPRISQRFAAQSIPMLLVLDHGQVVAQQIGAVPEAALRTWLEQGLARVKPTAGAEPAP